MNGTRGVIACMVVLVGCLLPACDSGTVATPTQPKVAPTATQPAVALPTVTEPNAALNIGRNPAEQAPQAQVPAHVPAGIAPALLVSPQAGLPSRTPTSSPAPPASRTAPTAPRKTATPQPAQAVPRLQVLATGFGSPDDVTVTASGDILFGDFGNGALNILRPGGKPVRLAGGFKEPEGIAVMKDGGIIVVEQTNNTLVEVNAATSATKLLKQLVNKTGKDGVDGIAIDPNTGDLLIPDSPNGRLLRMSRDGSSLQTIASGFVRPTGVAVEASGSLLVADEFGNAVYRLSKSGRRTRLASIYQPDDVVVGHDGSIYTNSLKGTIYRIDPVTNRLTVLTSGLKLPHGLAVAPDGTLVLAEAGRNRILRLTP